MSNNEQGITILEGKNNNPLRAGTRPAPTIKGVPMRWGMTCLIDLSNFEFIAEW
jgi:hypothetical protein